MTPTPIVTEQICRALSLDPSHVAGLKIEMTARTITVTVDYVAYSEELSAMAHVLSKYDVKLTEKVPV